MFENLSLRASLTRQLSERGLADAELIPMETSTVPDWEEATPFIGAIFYLAILAYPNLDDVDKRDELADALRARHSKLAINYGVRKRSQVAPEFRKLPNQQIQGRISRAEKRIAKRFEMARIYGFVKLQERFSGNASMTKYFRERSASNESTLRMMMRDWRDAKPVLHLASALWFELPSLFPSTDPPNIYWSIEELLFLADDWVRRLLYQAENNRLHYAMESTIRPDEQVAVLYPDMP